MKWGVYKSSIFVLVLTISFASCVDDSGPCTGLKEFETGTRDTFLTAFGRFDTAFFEFKTSSSQKKIRPYLVIIDTIYTKDRHGCDNNCTMYETEVLKLERVDGTHSIEFSNNNCTKRRLSINGKDFSFGYDTVIVQKNDSIVLSLDSGLMYFQSGRNYILKRIR